MCNIENTEKHLDSLRMAISHSRTPYQVCECTMQTRERSLLIALSPSVEGLCISSKKHL